MLHGGNGKSVAGLDEKLAEYQKLREQFDRLRLQLRRAEREKQSVNERIFEKVTGEYNRQLDDIRSKMTPLKEALDEIRIEIERELVEAAKAVEQAEETLAETRFRHLVGEFTDEEHERRIKSDSAVLDERRQRHTDLKLLLEAFDAASNDGTSDLADPGPHAHERLETEPRRPVPSPPPAAPAETPAAGAHGSRAEPSGGFVDPNEWFKETSAADRAMAHNSPRRPPLSERGTQPTSAGIDSKALPNLLVRTGLHRGRQIPLLPMTMSIGREHDNNIELKDPEVARYHARLRYERGEFTVDDLDGSTGTFINGLRVKEAILHDGDVLRVGGTELAVEYAAQTT